MISLIAAIGLNRELGKDNQLLWHLKNDLQHFKSITQNKICIQGKNTYQSIVNQLGKALPKRQNIILTRDLSFQVQCDNCHIFHSVESILYEYKNLCDSDEEIMIIGGEQIYNLFLPYADRLYLTIVESIFPDADTFFPAISDEWEAVKIQSHEKDSDNEYNHHFVTYEKNRKFKNN